jgi:hypothetical protein
MTVRLLEELDDFEKLTLVPISYSRIDTFSRCQAKYFYKYVTKFQETGPMPYAWLGNIVHGVLEEQLKPNQPIRKKHLPEYLEEFEIQKEIYDPDGCVTPELLAAGKKCIVDFIDKHAGTQYSILEKEKQFNLVAGTAYVTGYIDRVDINRRSKVITITDYKSGMKEVAAKNISTNLQLGIYALALKREYPDYDIYGELYYLRTGRQKGHLFTDSDLFDTECRFVQAVNDMINTTDYKATSNVRDCNYCPFATDGTCSTGARRVR